MNDTQTETSTQTTEAPITNGVDKSAETANDTGRSEGLAPEASRETKMQENNANKNGYDFVEMAPEVKARFDRVYGQMKAQDRKYSEALNVLKEQSEVIQQLQQGVGQVVQHINTQNFQDAEEKAREDANAAFQKGDSKAYLSAMEKVSEIKAQKIAEQVVAKRFPQQQPKQPQQIQNAADVANRAASQGHISSAEVPLFEAWQNETDERGNLVRPWAHRDMSDPGSFDSNLLVSASVFANPKFKNATIEQKLNEVDRLMGLQRNQSQQNVMGANLTTKTKTNTVRVSSDMEKVLLRTAPRGPKGKNTPDPIAWYRDQVQKAKQQGSRR